VEAGMDVARLNFSHGSHEEHAENIARIRAVADETDVPVAILADLQGPKLRVGAMSEEGVFLETGTQATLVVDDVIGDDPRSLPVQYEGLPRLVVPGDRILMDDGLIELRVLEASDRKAHCQVVSGGLLQSNKGLNLPGASPDIPSITDKDRDDLTFALAQGVDWVALSFVRTGGEVSELKELIRELEPGRETVPVMAKVEKPAAIENIDEIIDVADAVMVARGDLGIELSPEEVPMAQKRIIRACNQAGIPVVTATQMLDSMIRNPRPTRAEASDVANAVLDGTDAIMLSGETSIGAFPLQAVRTMVRIAAEVEVEREESWTCPHMLGQGASRRDTADAVSFAARETAHAVDAAAIVTPTVSGYTARLMSRHRPHVPIVAVTPSRGVQRQLMLYWGVYPLYAPRTDNTDHVIEHAVRAALARRLVRRGDTLVVSAGAAGSAPGTTNLIRVHVVDS
jgi:pyruvate kinase